MKSEHGTQLVAETEWMKDFVVPCALRHHTARCLMQRAHTIGVAGNIHPLVHIVSDELISKKVGFGPLRNLLLIGSRKQERRRVRSHRPPQTWQQLSPKRLRVEAELAELDDRLCRIPAHGIAGHP